MSIAQPIGRPRRRPNYRLRRAFTETASAGFGVVLLLWSLLPVYNITLIALDPKGDTEFKGDIWPTAPTLDSFRAVLFEGFWYLEDFWHQLGNSFSIGLMTMVLTVVLSSLASFSLGRMRLSKGWVVSNTALLLYTIPAYFLVIPYYLLMHKYGLINSLWSVIAADTAFTLPYALFILQWYGRLIPMEFDEAARVDGATPWQVYWHVYVPLMAPALAAVGTYALLVAWNEYLYQFLLLHSRGSKTVAITIAEFFENDDSPWNLMMAAALVYCVPPIVIFYALRRYIAAGLTLGGVKG